METTDRRRRVRMSAERRREQLLVAATALISERGYRGLSLQDVADACDLTMPGVLHHFPSKDALLVAVLERRDALDAAALAQRLGPGRHDLATVCAAVVDRNAGQREVVRLYAVLEAESLDPAHPASAYFAARQEEALAFFAEHAPEGGDARAVARRTLALLDGLQLQWLREPGLDLRATWAALAAGLL